MTQRSLLHPANLSQPSLPKKRKFCHLNELPVSKELYLSLKNSKKKNHRRWAKIVEIIYYFIQKGKGICYTQTKTWVGLLKKEGFKASEETIKNDFNDLEKLGLIWRNSWTRPKHGGSGGVRHLITCWNLHRYENEYIQAINKKGIGKPEKTKKEFYQYKELVMTTNFPKHNAFLRKKKTKKISLPKITLPSEETLPTEDNSPHYVFKNYMYISPHPKIARKRRKKRTTETKNLKNQTQNQIPWDPACLNDPEWVVREAIHQGCDAVLSQKIVEAIQIKGISLKENLMRATLHVAKSKKEEYINAITTITETQRERKHLDSVYDLQARSTRDTLKFFDDPRIRDMLQSRDVAAILERKKQQRMADIGRCLTKYGAY